MIEIYNEDCLDTLKRMKDNSVDLFLQDTPFNVTQNDWDVKIQFDVLWKEWLRVGKINCPFIFFGTQPFTTDLINSQRSLFKYDLIWYKPLGSGHLNSKRMPMRNHEEILIFYHKPPTYNPIMGVGVRKKGVRKADRNGTNYGKFAVDKDEKFDALHILFKNDCKNVKKIIINTDCLNVMHCCQNNKAEIKKYRLNVYEFQELTIIFKKIMKGKNIEVEFRHVRSHKGVNNARSYVNEWCDREAKKYARIRFNQN